MAVLLHVLVTFLNPEEGGRYKLPVLEGYSPHFVIPPNTEMLGVEFIAGPTDYRADEEINATVKCLYQPFVSYAGLTAGTRFKIVEGMQVVGSGVVLKST